jgi:hypothetical protein
MREVRKEKEGRSYGEGRKGERKSISHNLILSRSGCIGIQKTLK